MADEHLPPIPYAFTRAGRRPVPCLARVTNRVGGDGGFKTGEADRAAVSLQVGQAIVRAWTGS
jgi:hypothetical protein